MIQLLPSYIVLRDHVTVKGDDSPSNLEPDALSDKQLKMIEKESKKILKKESDNLKNWGLVAASQNYRYKQRDAGKTLVKALEENGGWAFGWYMLGAILYGADKLAASIEVLDNAMSLYPEIPYLKEIHSWVTAKAAGRK